MGKITLQFVADDSFISWAIRKYQRGWCSHVDSVMPDGSLLGAHYDGGVLVRPASYGNWTRVERVTLEVPTYQALRYYEFLGKQIGKPYDNIAIAAFAFPCLIKDRNWRLPDSWFCDELVAAGLERCGRVGHLAPGVRRLTVRDVYLLVSALTTVKG